MIGEKGLGGGIGEHMQLGDNRGAHPFLPCPPGATVGFGDSSLTAMRSLKRSLAVFTIIRTGSAQALSQPTVVYFNASSNGSAVEGVDFILPQRAVTFGPDSTSVEGVVVILEHSGVDLQQRSFQISLTAVENGSLGTDGRLLTVVIISSQSKLSVVHVCVHVQEWLAQYLLLHWENATFQLATTSADLCPPSPHTHSLPLVTQLP